MFNWNILYMLKYGVTKNEYEKVVEMFKKDKGEALWYCKRLGYKRLVQHYQKKLWNQ